MDNLSRNKNFLVAFDEPVGSIFLLLLLSADCLFILLHFVYKFKWGGSLIPFASDPLLSIEKDRGHAEWFQYLKQFWIVILMVTICIRRKTFAYVSWAMLFLYLGLDDALQLHERIGRQIGLYITSNPPFNLRPQDIGELGASAMAGAILISLIILAYARGTRSFRKDSRGIGALFLVLIFFGVGVDTLHAAMRNDATLDLYLGVLEDGGEMLATSFILWYAFFLYMQGRIDGVMNLSPASDTVVRPPLFGRVANASGERGHPSDRQ